MTPDSRRRPAGGRGAEQTDQHGGLDLTVQRPGDGRDDTSYGVALFRQHAELLAASGIPPEVATERGYVSVDTKGQLDAAGFSKAQKITPGLLIPVHCPDGEVRLHQYRPDNPRLDRDGRERKYETPWRARMRLDCPPRCRPAVADPTVPLWITEGVRKADAAAAAGLCCLALLGVWNWRGSNDKGGSTALADWHDVALRGRDVFVCFDSDVMTKASVRSALDGLTAYLANKGATVKHVYLPDGGDGGKVGLDDYLACGHTVDELHALARDPAATAGQHELPPAEPVSTPSRNRATAQPPRLAYAERILDRLAEEVRKRGLIGEERLAQTLYLVLTSRLLDKQVSAGVKGHSSSGKSYTVEVVTRFFPPDAYLEFTAMSQRALVYSTESYAHRTLIVYEVVALREGVEDDLTSYFVRSLLSEGRIDYDVTVRGEDGGFTTKKIVKEGPTNLIFTTTKTKVHAENETRILSLATDDSREQTARVLLELAAEDHTDDDLDEWHQLQHWLAGAEHRVTIPYARAVASAVAPVAVRLRRDFGSVLALVRAHAVLHQASRRRDAAGRVVAELADYAAVRDLIADVIAEGVGSTVSPVVRETVEAVAALAGPDGVMASRVADKLALDKSNVSRRLRMAADGGYVHNLEDKRGRPGRWVIGDPLPETVALLPDPAQLATADATADLRGCAVAPLPERENDAVPLAEGDQETRVCAICGLPTDPALGYHPGCQETR